jgi:hypothetical protein
MRNPIPTNYPAWAVAFSLSKAASGYWLRLASVALWTWLAIISALTSSGAQSWTDGSWPVALAQASPDSVNREWEDLFSAVRKAPRSEDPAIPDPPARPSPSLRAPPVPQEAPPPPSPVEVNPVGPAQTDPSPSSGPSLKAAAPQPASNPRPVPKQKPRTEPETSQTDEFLPRQKQGEVRSVHQGANSPARQAEERLSRSKVRPERPRQASSPAQRNSEERSGFVARRAVEPEAASASRSVPSAGTLKFPRGLISAHAQD